MTMLRRGDTIHVELVYPMEIMADCDVSNLDLVRAMGRRAMARLIENPGSGAVRLIITGGPTFEEMGLGKDSSKAESEMPSTRTSLENEVASLLDNIPQD